MVAPVPAIGLDQVGREDLAGAEGDDRDLPLVGDGQDPLPGMSRADVEMVQAAGPAQGDRALRCFDMCRTVAHVPSHLSPVRCHLCRGLRHLRGRELIVA